MRGQPPPDLTPLDARVILDLLTDLESRLAGHDVSSQVNFVTNKYKEVLELSLPKPSTTTYGLNSFSYSSVKYWNSLPDHFRKTVDYSEFKRKLLVHSFS